MPSPAPVNGTNFLVQVMASPASDRVTKMATHFQVRVTPSPAPENTLTSAGRGATVSRIFAGSGGVFVRS
jgi:hypothetical protein